MTRRIPGGGIFQIEAAVSANVLKGCMPAATEEQQGGHRKQTGMREGQTDGSEIRVQIVEGLVHN